MKDKHWWNSCWTSGKVVPTGLMRLGASNCVPYLGDALVGRIRPAYVRSMFHRSGAGRLLLEELLRRASHFSRLQLRATGERVFFF